MNSIRRAVAPLSLVALVALAACSGGGDTTETTVYESTTTTIPPATFTLRAGALQLAVLDAPPQAALQVLNTEGLVIAEGTVDDQGSLLFRNLQAGTYRVATADDSQMSEPAEVYDASWLPGPDFYASQQLPAGGFGYLTTRDGTTLSINVSLPGPAEGGPYPTVVEYSGYSPSNPDELGSAQLYNALGFAYAGINMRGTGCSGGSFQFFELSQLLDGYDAIEIVAAQPWVLNNKVGMVGVSYPGISQLFVASTQPPSLAAIAPLSVLDDSYRGTLYPGGILNTGFAVPWTQERMNSSAVYGQAWSKERADSGDAECASNQRLRLQNPNLVELIEANPFYSPETADQINPTLFVDSINVPVFIAGAWQDEQTGGRFPSLLDNFTNAPKLFVTLTNGLHTDSLGPSVLSRYVEYLNLFIADRVPDLTAIAAPAAVLFNTLFGVDPGFEPENRFADMSLDEARSAFERDGRVRVLFENGAADGQPNGSPVARWSAEFPSWPIPTAEPLRFNFGAEGVMAPSLPGTGSTAYRADPTAVPPTFYEGSGSAIWRADTVYNWVRNPEGTAAVFTSEPLTEDLVLVGPSSADLWISTDATDTDLEVTISEVRADGSEVYVQSGWLRASQRALDDSESPELRPVHSQLQAAAVPLVAGEATPVRVEIFPAAHPFRKGSRIRVTIDAPGGNRAVWQFRTISAGESVTIVHDATRPSSIVLSVVRGLEVPRGDAPCGALRGQPCRAS
ncbi:MAG: CocE/NonD family hydrolase [Ilumatobacteraceae bacterium]